MYGVSHSVQWTPLHALMIRVAAPALAVQLAQCSGMKLLTLFGDRIYSAFNMSNLVQPIITEPEPIFIFLGLALEVLLGLLR